SMEYGSSTTNLFVVSCDCAHQFSQKIKLRQSQMLLRDAYCLARSTAASKATAEAPVGSLVESSSNMVCAMWFHYRTCDLREKQKGPVALARGPFCLLTLSWCSLRARSRAVQTVRA